MTKKLLVLALSSFAIGGCGDSGTGIVTPSGRYELRTANGSELPFVTVEEDETIGLEQGHIQINSDGTYSFSLTFAATVGETSGTEAGAAIGTWNQQGNQLTLASPDRDTLIAVVSGGGIVMILGEVSMTFRKDLGRVEQAYDRLLDAWKGAKEAWRSRAPR